MSTDIERACELLEHAEAILDGLGYTNAEAVPLGEALAKLQRMDKVADKVVVAIREALRHLKPVAQDDAA